MVELRTASTAAVGDEAAASAGDEVCMVCMGEGLACVQGKKDCAGGRRGKKGATPELVF